MIDWKQKIAAVMQTTAAAAVTSMDIPKVFQAKSSRIVDLAAFVQ
jgi:hypothetical protein